MTHRRNILTVDGHQVAVVDRVVVVLKHQIQQWKHKFSKEMNIGYGGIGCIYQKPIEGLIIWSPEQN